MVGRSADEGRGDRAGLEGVKGRSAGEGRSDRAGLIGVEG